MVKDGGLPGFSSEVWLMPQRRLAIVVLVNSRSRAKDPSGRYTFRPAETLAANIGYNLLFALPWKATP
jgi:CubicO group peptidase (beta-lactamase class C family)